MPYTYVHITSIHVKTTPTCHSTWFQGIWWILKVTYKLEEHTLVRNFNSQFCHFIILLNQIYYNVSFENRVLLGLIFIPKLPFLCFYFLSKPKFCPFFSRFYITLIKHKRFIKWDQSIKFDVWVNYVTFRIVMVGILFNWALLKLISTLEWVVNLVLGKLYEAVDNICDNLKDIYKLVRTKCRTNQLLYHGIMIICLKNNCSTTLMLIVLRMSI